MPHLDVVFARKTDTRRGGGPLGTVLGFRGGASSRSLGRGIVGPQEEPFSEGVAVGRVRVACYPAEGRY